MTRRPYKPRTYLYNCPACHTWQPIATLESQAQCRAAGACPRCQRDSAWLLRVKVAAIEEHLERLVTLGKAAPEQEKARYRAMWRTKQQQLVDAHARLAALMPEGVKG